MKLRTVPQTEAVTLAHSSIVLQHVAEIATGMPLRSASGGTNGLNASSRTSSGHVGIGQQDLPERIRGRERGTMPEAGQAVVGERAAAPWPS